MKKLFLILAFFSASAFAQSKLDGNEMLEIMKDSQLSDNFYMGYIAGVANMMACTPPKTTIGQIYDVVKVYLEQNPATRHEFRGTLVFRALADAYPCKQEIVAKSKKPV
jgi:hypothetical protein